MKKIEIKKAVGLVQRELTKYGLMTPGQGIDFPVSIIVVQMKNEVGRMVPNIVATWKETFQVDFNEYTETETDKLEELDRYFNAELFVNGIIQRAAWIQAKHEDRVAYLEENPGGHPALYKVWAESRVVA